MPNRAKPIRQLAIELLKQEQGINETSWSQLRTLLIQEGGNNDIIDRVDATDGSFYLPEGFQDEA